MSAKTPLKVGLLIDGPTPTAYVRELATWAAGQADVEVSHAIICKTEKGSHALDVIRRHGLYNFLGRAARKLILTVETKVFKAGDAGGGRVADLVPNVLEICPKVSPSGLVHRHTEDDIETIRSLGLDVLLRCGTGILKGGILDVCPFGVLSFHHGDNRVNRGGPAGFWEVYHRWDESGFIIQRLNEELDGGQVLFRGAIATRPFFATNAAALRKASTPYMKDLLQRLAATRALPPAEAPHIYSGPLFKSPTLLQMGTYAWRALGRIARKAGRKVFGLRATWNVALLAQDFPDLTLWRRTDVHAPDGRSWADPFLWRRDGETYCLVEDYVAGGRGHIAALRIDGPKAWTYLGPALEEDFHLSFPFMFEHEGAVYLCPETRQAREIRVYRTDSFPLGWTHHATLMRDVAAVDTMLFQHDGRWWMLTTLDRGTGESTGELSLFFADSPLSADWTPHPLNPLMVTPAGGRNAGLVIKDGRIYRCAQRQGFDAYGKGLLVFEITRLTTTDYAERLVSRANPDFGAFAGVHHLSAIDGLAVFDMLAYRRP